ncbi:hypothetical protein H1R20_g11465, partial [Candolleomyces eurysporus]
MAGEATFDLLNDKISFFESKSGLGSYLDDDPSFDMSFGESNAEAEAEEEEEAQTAQPQSVLPSPVLKGQAKGDPPLQSETILRDVTSDVNRSTDVSRADARTSPEAVTPKHSRAALVNPPPVLGLRIVKRGQHLKTGIASSPKVAPSSKTQPAKRSSIEPVGHASREPQSRRSSFQNTAAPLGLNRGGGNGVLKTNPVPARASATTSSRTIGPRRVLVTEEPEKKPTRPPIGYTRRWKRCLVARRASSCPYQREAFHCQEFGKLHQAAIANKQHS